MQRAVSTSTRLLRRRIHREHEGTMWHKQEKGEALSSHFYSGTLWHLPAPLI